MSIGYEHLTYVSIFYNQLIDFKKTEFYVALLKDLDIKIDPE